MAARGKLFDRENRLLVDNYPSVSCFLVREQGRNVDADLPLIARGLNLDLEQLRATLRRYRAAPGYQPIPIKQDITADEQAFIEAHRNELPELETIDEERRLYPRDGFAAHLIGYVGEVSEDDLNNPRYAAYEPGDVVGKAGVEETYDELLRGQDGSRDVIVDSHGREVGYLGTQHAIPGQDLQADHRHRPAARRRAGPGQTATAPSWPWTRATARFWPWSRAPATTPTPSPCASIAPTGTSSSTTPTIPLMNKAIQAQLAPGSTFKILMSVAGLQEGIAQNMKINCAGGWGPYGFFHHCDEHHGAVDIHNAIPFSCDTFYYMLGDKLGIDRIAKYATGLRLRPEDRHRSARRAGGADALGAVEAEELPCALVSGRNPRCVDRPGRGGGYAAAIGADHRRHRLGRTSGPAARGIPRSASGGLPQGSPR